MIALVRALAQGTATLLLGALALVGLTVALFCIEAAPGDLSLPTLARDLDGPGFRETVGTFLGRLEAPGPVEWVPLLAGLGGIVAGVLLLVGVFVRRRERMVVVDDGPAGRIEARRRALAQVAAATTARERATNGAGRVR